MKIPKKKKFPKVKTPGPQKKQSYHKILGFRAIERPAFIETLEFPSTTLTTLDAANVSELHAQYSVLFSYANQRFTQVEVRILQLNRQRAEAEIQIMQEDFTIAGMDKWRRDAKISSFDPIQYIDQKVTVAQIERRTLAGLKENYLSLIAALSRELSRRQYNVRPTEGF